MSNYMGDFAHGQIVYTYFNTFSSNDPSASVTMTNFVDTDVHIHRDDNLTQRNDTAGVAVDVDVDGIAGTHFISIDTSEDTVANFWQAGHDYFIRIEGATVDSGAINAVVGCFSLENRRVAGEMAKSQIATLASQTSFTLTAGEASGDDDAYNGCTAIITDEVTMIQKCAALISDYTGSSRTVTLAVDPAVFTMAVQDKVSILAGAKHNLRATVAVADARTLDIESTGEAGVDFDNIVGTLDASEIGANAIGASELATDAIGAAQIAANAIGASEIADGAIDAATFAAGAIDATAIATDAIGAAEIAANAIGASELAADAIGDSQIATGAIAATAFAAGAIDASAIATDAIGAAEIAANAIGASELATDAIGAAQIATDAIGAAEIAANAIGSSEIATDAIDAVALATDARNEIVDQVWDELRSAHVTIGSFGHSFAGVIGGVAEAGTLSTTQMTTDLAEATNDHYIGRTIVWITGVLAGQASDITDYVGATGRLDYTAVTEAPSATDEFVLV